MKKAFKKFKRQFSGERTTTTKNNGRTRLHALRRASSIDVLNACDHADEQEVDVMLNDGHNINDLFLGTTLLNRAVDNNDTDLVGYLIRNGADVNKPVNGINPIHKSIIQKKTDILRLLLTSSTNADVSIQMVSNGNSPLHLAIEKCDLETVNILLQYGSDTTLKNRHGDTALHVAAKIAFAESFRLLVEHGANVSLINSKGETALDIASRQKGFEGSNFVEWLS